MQYQKLISGETIVEFHNNWLGVETVIANGRVVSQKSSVWGINHYFTVIEDGHQTRYVLTSRINSGGMEVVLDLTKNGALIHEAVPLHYGVKAAPPFNKNKKQGLKYLKEYELEESLEAFEKALQVAPKDPEIYFHMACAYSVMEQSANGFEALRMAFELGLQDEESVLNHDMLAFIRMNEAFADFLTSGFKAYDKDRVENGRFLL